MSWKRWSWVAGLAVVGACSFGTYSGGDDGPGAPPGTGTGQDDAGSSNLSDLPCEVAAILESTCLLCHGPVPANGAQDRLDSLSALRAPSRSQPSKSYAQLALERMQSTASPMPPAPYAPATAAQIAQWSAWVSGGTQAGSCVPDPDAGVPPVGDGGVGGPSDAGVSGDLPCDVAHLLGTYCTACHGSPPTNGAPVVLSSLQALRAPSPDHPSQSEGERASFRMSPASSAQPMPPSPYAAVPVSERNAFANWIAAGMPAGSCTAPNDGGVPPVADGGIDAGHTDAGVAGDLPCGIAGTLATYCTACHGSPPTNGAPFSLNSRAALLAMSPTFPGQTRAQRSLVRMQSSTEPMPPAPYARVPTAKVNEFSGWVSGGTPAGTCTAPADGGSPPLGDAGVDAGTPDAGVSGDLPCDVADVLTSSCTRCHGNPPTGGAPMPLTSRAQLRAPSPSNASVSTGQACVNRMASTTAPMPPPPAAPVAAAKQSAFASWVSAGMPAGACTVDAGAPDPVFSGPPTCTSNVYWTRGESESPEMHPGRACIACHQGGGGGEDEGEGPDFAIAGTAYPTGHEYDDCYGSAAQGAVVRVTDRNGITRSFTANRAGNFYGSASGGWPAFPIRAEITLGGETRVMSGAVNSGDCNSCHTLQGTSGAPGRVALP
jgi:uncharacterized membrane protein